MNADLANQPSSARNDAKQGSAPQRDPDLFASRDDAMGQVSRRVVIVGGGAGGLELAAQLGRHRSSAPTGMEVLLIDASLIHVWKPLLHELAAGTLRTAEGDVDFLQQARRHGFRFQLGTLESMDRQAQQIWLAPLVDEFGEEIAPRRTVAYDVAVIAVGSVVNDFGTPGVKEHAVALNTAADAQRFHRRLLGACARAEWHGDRPVNVVIVGGGATGVELAAELSEAVAVIASYGPHLSRLKRPVGLRLIEAAPRILGALAEDVARKIHADLEQLGVDVRPGQKVSGVAKDSVTLASGEQLPADITVWAAGIQGPAVLHQLDGLELNPMGQLVVGPSLQTTRDPHVFAIGDCASCRTDPAGEPVPPRAQAAQQEADLLARTLPDYMRGHALPPFHFHDKGALVTLGMHNAVARLTGAHRGRGITLEGTLARWAYWVLQRQHMVALHGPLRTVLLTLGGWLTASSRPRVKLH
ncbi:MAG: NAD(P)/FAD-dependent oxidoreductase [Pseudomonadota bacterium]